LYLGISEVVMLVLKSCRVEKKLSAPAPN
jgi:hypothetical protein